MHFRGTTLIHNKHNKPVYYALIIDNGNTVPAYCYFSGEAQRRVGRPLLLPYTDRQLSISTYSLNTPYHSLYIIFTDVKTFIYKYIIPSVFVKFLLLYILLWQICLNWFYKTAFRSICDYLRPILKMQYIYYSPHMVLNRTFT